MREPITQHYTDEVYALLPWALQEKGAIARVKAEAKKVLEFAAAEADAAIEIERRNESESRLRLRRPKPERVMKLNCRRSPRSTSTRRSSGCFLCRTNVRRCVNCSMAPGIARPGRMPFASSKGFSAITRTGGAGFCLGGFGCRKHRERMPPLWWAREGRAMATKKPARGKKAAVKQPRNTGAKPKQASAEDRRRSQIRVGLRPGRRRETRCFA
jgi:hypothetical protein